MPICSVGMDLCILVLYAVDSIAMTSNAVEFLTCIARAATERDKGFLSSSMSSMVTSAKTEQYVGIWDMQELLKKYSKDVEFRLLPMDKLQNFYDYQEFYSLMELFGDFRDSRDSECD